MKRKKRPLRARVALPRPKGTRPGRRATLTITMHPRTLKLLEERARGASMSLTRYVTALLESDAEDVVAPSSSSSCPHCGHSEALHGETGKAVGFPDLATPITCAFSGCTCTITPREWRAETSRPRSPKRRSPLREHIEDPDPDRSSDEFWSRRVLGAGDG